MKKTSVKKKLLCILLSLLMIITVVYIIRENNTIVLTEITVACDNLPEGFNGYKIAQISDLHNAEIGKDNANLIEMLNNSSPDIIVFTGDVFDSRRTNIEIPIKLALDAVKIAPCYYVTGNHEEREREELQKLIIGFESVGVTILRNDSTTLEYSDDMITLVGVDDPTFGYNPDKNKNLEEILDEVLKNITPNDDTFKLLLSHRPEFIDVYDKYDFDIVLTGHAHGGQIRIPFIGGLVAPGQGLFPKFTSGLYRLRDTNMIVSRGIGNSIFPFRINNRPEVILISLSVD